MISINLQENDIVFALKQYILELVERKNTDNRYTKFDSNNDIFLGILGEIAFEKYLSNIGFIKDTDFVKVSDKINSPTFSKFFTSVGDKKYDKMDFLLKLFYDINGNPIDLMKIDVKTQKYIGNYNENWQFAVNKNTVEKINGKENIIDNFVFIFSKNGIEDFIDIDFENKSINELREIYKKIRINLKQNSINLEILGIIEPKKFLVLAEEFKENEIFRVNKNKDKLNAFKSVSSMYRISLKYLSNIEKIIPPRKLNFDYETLINYKKLFQNENRYVKIENDKSKLLFPYNKVYLNSQYKDFNELINNFKSNNIKGYKQKI